MLIGFAGLLRWIDSVGDRMGCGDLVSRLFGVGEMSVRLRMGRFDKMIPGRSFVERFAGVGWSLTSNYYDRLDAAWICTRCE